MNRFPRFTTADVTGAYGFDRGAMLPCRGPCPAALVRCAPGHTRAYEGAHHVDRP